MADEVEDPYPTIRQECQEHHCPAYAVKLNECSERVSQAAGSTEETCVEEFFDLMECVDHCAAPKLFEKLV
ncbi:MAG: hypothetical protein SGCHY_004766 [Lobulomycetales sp.]